MTHPNRAKKEEVAAISGLAMAAQHLPKVALGVAASVAIWVVTTITNTQTQLTTIVTKVDRIEKIVESLSVDAKNAFASSAVYGSKFVEIERRISRVEELHLSNQPRLRPTP